MTRFLLLAALLAGLVPAAVAQSSPVSVPTPARAGLPRYQFCELTYDGSWVRMAYGKEESNKTYQVKDDDLLSQAIVVEKLHSSSVALNYMSAQGWEIVGVAATTIKLPTAGGYTNWERVYTLRRPLP